jgi:hypothetical protein
MEDHALRLYIRAKPENGHLLLHASVPNVWGGPGNDDTCDGCEEIVTKHQLGMDGVGITGDKVQFHVKCFYVWVAEPDLSDRSEPRDDRRSSYSPTNQGLKRRTTDISTFSPVPSHAPPPGTPVAGP